MRRWPLFLIASPAAVAVWSGWVGLGSMCGFGVVHPLPGIWDGLRLNTAITLPVGVESYGAYALGAWLTPGAPEAARTFARRSAIGALVLGMLGQVAYHLLTATHATRAPWPVVVLVSCLPVVTLGFGAALMHLLRGTPEAALVDVPGTVTQIVPEALPSAALTAAGPITEAVPETGAVSARRRSQALPGRRSRPRTPHRAPEQIFRDELEAGTVPGVREIKRRMKVGQVRAQEIRDSLSAAMSERPETIEATA